MSLQWTQYGLADASEHGALALHNDARDECVGMGALRHDPSAQDAAHEAQRGPHHDDPQHALLDAQVAAEQAWEWVHAHVHHNPIEVTEAHDPASNRGEQELRKGLSHRDVGPSVLAGRLLHTDPTKMAAAELARIAEQYRQLLELDDAAPTGKTKVISRADRIRVHAVKRLDKHK